MNNATILQIPISKSLRDEVETLVRDTGFSSLQEYLRVHLTQLKNSVIRVVTEPKTIKLSAKNAKRYDKMTEDILSGKVKTKSFTDVNSMMAYLNR